MRISWFLRLAGVKAAGFTILLRLVSGDAGERGRETGGTKPHRKFSQRPSEIAAEF